MSVIPDTIPRRLEILFDVFIEFAQEGNASFQMDEERGGLFIQLSNRDWPDGVEERIAALSRQSSQVEVIRTPYSWIIKCKGDRIKA